MSSRMVMRERSKLASNLIYSAQINSRFSSNTRLRIHAHMAGHGENLIGPSHESILWSPTRSTKTTRRHRNYHVKLIKPKWCQVCPPAFKCRHMHPSAEYPCSSKQQRLTHQCACAKLPWSKSSPDRQEWVFVLFCHLRKCIMQSLKEM